MGAPPGAAIPWPNSAIIPPLRVPDVLPPVVEGPGIRSLPPDGRQSSSVVLSATPTKVAPMRPWRQAVLLYNEDGTNAVRYGEASNVSGVAAQLVGALLPANGTVVLHASAEVWAVAVAGGPRLTVVDEWYSAPPQRQAQGV